jgi:Cu(I)/Ag(I) efflux system membrane protein CusA/SilA
MESTGLVTSFLLELTIYPAIFSIWRGRALPQKDYEKSGER